MTTKLTTSLEDHIRDVIVQYVGDPKESKGESVRQFKFLPPLGTFTAVRVKYSDGHEFEFVLDLENPDPCDAVEECEFGAKTSARLDAVTYTDMMPTYYGALQNFSTSLPAWEVGTFREMLEQLLLITRGCRADMHEPDEQGITAKVTGKILDNAGVPGEMKVLIRKNGSEEICAINLASLIALARYANLT